MFPQVISWDHLRSKLSLQLTQHKVSLANSHSLYEASIINTGNIDFI